MQDCSYFLRGLCTNMACPYRHVKTNSSAPVCEDFLKGYCACHKKHSYVCPSFEATGECPQKSICKLHHPKKKVASKTSRPGIHPNSSWGRYFDTSVGRDRETGKHVFSGGDFVDFMTLDAVANADVTAVDASDDVQMMGLNSGYFSSQADDLMH
ncbi:hypothetical protein BRADI_3g44276v3 [Brachypodium distachyon]|uniref:C3H1-type domain-containing protein n=1 Tax=Brachypodium distachyon TaxID=15368 RepID=A0A0Q3FK42_BRADI|nr:hypothetical protein BRADI_3g44276v3 [Brachypodium distachyon]